MTATSPFQNFSAAVCKDQATEKLRRALAPVTFDGSEILHVVDQLRGLENEIVASAIRHAILSQYRDTIPADAVVEIVGRLLESGEIG
jgi:hypothetical protein